MESDIFIGACVLKPISLQRPQNLRKQLSKKKQIPQSNAQIASQRIAIGDFVGIALQHHLAFL